MASVLFSLTFVLLAISHTVLSTKFSDCGCRSGVVTNVDVKGCETGDTCILKKGTVADITIEFSSKIESFNLTAVVYGIIHNVPIPFHIPHSDACQNSGITCPLHSNENYVYRNQLDVKDIYPSVAVVVKWELKDQNGADMICVLIPSKLE